MNDKSVNSKYAAGFFDGDGSVSIVSPPARNHIGKRYMLLVRVWQVTEHDEVLQRLKNTYGGRLSYRTFNSGRPATEWRLSDAAAEDFLREIHPFLLVKANRVDIALKFRDTYNHGNFGRAGNDKMKQIYKERDHLKSLLNQMNQRHTPTR